MLDGQLSPVDRTSLYWALLQGRNKGHHPPEGDLGPRYEFTYVLLDVNYDPVRVREFVYLDADPPVAFAPKGQIHELYPGDVRKVPWGWRPFPEPAVNVVRDLMEEAQRPVGPADSTGRGTYLGPALFVIFLGALAWSHVHRRRPQVTEPQVGIAAGVRLRRALASLFVGAMVGLTIASLVEIPRLVGPWNIRELVANAVNTWGIFFGGFAAVVSGGMTFALLNRRLPRASRWGRAIAGVALGALAILTMWIITAWGIPPFSLEGMWIYPLAILPAIAAFALLRGGQQRD